MKNLREHRLYTLFLLVILLLMILEVLYTKPADRRRMSVIDIPMVDHMAIDFPCNVFIAKGEEEAVVFDGQGKIEKTFKRDARGMVLHLCQGAPSFTAVFNRLMLPDRPKPNLYIRIKDPGKIVLGEKLTVISSEHLSDAQTGLLSSIETWRQLLMKKLLIG